MRITNELTIYVNVCSFMLFKLVLIVSRITLSKYYVRALMT